MKKLTALLLTITFGILAVSCKASDKPIRSTEDEDEEEVKQTVEIISEDETEETEAISEETTTEYIDPQCTDPCNGMVVRPNPDQYIDPDDIYYISFYYTEQQNNINFWMSTDIKGTTFSCSTGDGKSVNVVIDEEHAQQIFDELGKYKFYYWQTEDYQQVDENGVITQINPPYTFYIYSNQFWNTTEIRLNEEDLQAFLTYVKTYCETIYASQQGG